MMASNVEFKWIQKHREYKHLFSTLFIGQIFSSFKTQKCFRKSEKLKNLQRLNSNVFKNQKNKRIQNNV